MDVIITLPSSISWEEYQKELNIVKSGEAHINFKVPFIPKKCEVGDKCFLVHQGNIKGWMKVSGLQSGGFKCTTTGKWWEGNFIQRTGEFNEIDPIPMKGFQGFRYYEQN